MSNWTGILEMDVEARQGRTVTNNLYFQGALKIMRPVYHHPTANPCYYILNPGGGYLDGDTYKIKVSLQEEAKMTLTTQSATKVYKTPTKHAYQETEILLKKGSCLEYLPDPLIAYEDARYFQKNVVKIERGATFLYSEIITPGWSPEGKHFSYNMVRSLNEIYLDDELVVYDHIKLNPSAKNMDGLGFMEGYSHLGSFIAIGDQTNAALLDELFEAMNQETGDFKVGLSKLTVPGFSIRVLANKTQEIERIFTLCHHIISQQWFNVKPSFLRKY